MLERLTELFVTRGVPEHVRSDNGPEFVATVVRQWLAHLGVKTLYIEKRSPWENGYVESFNGKLRDELLDREIFDTVLEARVLTSRWRDEYNRVRPHSSLGIVHRRRRPSRPSRLRRHCCRFGNDRAHVVLAPQVALWYNARGKWRGERFPRVDGFTTGFQHRLNSTCSLGNSSFPEDGTAAAENRWKSLLSWRADALQAGHATQRTG